MDEPHAKGRSISVILFVAIAVLLSSVAILPARGDPDSMEQALALRAGPGAQGADERSSGSWNSGGYDFRAFADDEGFVDVILRPTGKRACSESIAISELQTMIESSASLQSGQDGAGAGNSLVTTRSFGVALDAFSVRLSIETLEGLLRQGQTYDIYPDMRVHATLDHSVVQVGADQLWDEVDIYGNPVTGDGIVVSVIDTGVDYMHPDLGGGFGPAFKIIGGYDFCNEDADPMDDNGHGTHVAGIVAADGDMPGVAPSAKIIAYKVLGPYGSGSMSDVILAISGSMDPNGDGNTEDHVDIISMSLGARGEVDDPVCIAVENAVEAGIVVVVSAGNDGPSMGTVSSPGLAPSAITVGAVDENGVLADFSSRGTGTNLMPKPEVSAPGVRILSTVPYDGTQLSSPTGYLSLSGTSMAAPHVAGAAALLLQQHPSWTPQWVKSVLVDCAGESSSSLWHAGAGNLWVPAAADATLFADHAVLAYGLALNASLSFGVANMGQAATFQVSAYDFYSLAVNGSRSVRQWTNYTEAVPSSVTIQSGSAGALSVAAVLPPSFAEGYYEGAVLLSDGTRTLRVPIGFAAVSILNVHVENMNGYEVVDYYGGVYIYSYPDAIFSASVRQSGYASPPASFILGSGDYSVHAAGHQLLYMYSDPYLLSQIVHVSPVEEVEVCLQMSSAKHMILDLETEDGCPIYVKNFRLYARFVGDVNVSFHLTNSDASIYGSAFFDLPLSRTIYVSDTPASVGFSITGYSYSRSMWDFMSRNWDHWYEYRTSTLTSFAITASADLEYQLAWEFDGIGTETPLDLGLEPGSYSTYVQKLEIPGAITDVWGGGGNHLSMGATSTFYVRRDTGTSINVAFSGMSRTTFIQGVFSHRYLPGSIYSTAFDLEEYVSDFSHLLPVTGYSGVYLPDRNHLNPLPVSNLSHSVGLGPFYPAITTMNTNTAFTLVHPILCDQAGARVAGWDSPSLTLSRNGITVSSMDLVEYQARPSAVRTIALGSTGEYIAEVVYHPGTQICTDTVVRLGFTVPASDVNPPRIESLGMPQKFVPGEMLPVQIRASDDSSVGSVQFMWRPHGSTSWSTVTLIEASPDVFSGSIRTSVSDSALDILVDVTDAWGNGLEYEASNASLAQIPILFELSASASEIQYMNGEVALTLLGRLTDLAGSPLSATAAVPIDLFVGGRKVAMVLDEYMVVGSHAHNGTIRFDWHFNPTELFTGPLETLDIDAVFDIGVYQRVSQRVTLTSTESTGSAPSITLISPANSSFIPAGTIISLSISDDGPFAADAYLDGTSLGALSQPWQVNTISWSDGRHALRIVATDSEGAASEAIFTFEVDASVPSVDILYPITGYKIPVGSVLQASVYDAYLVDVTYRVDGGASLPLSSPYAIDTTGWPEGTHTVEISAVDAVGKVGSDSVTFELSSSTAVVQVISPAEGSVAQSGVAIELSVEGADPLVVRWSEGGVWHDLGSLRSISTSGWSECTHNIVINVTDSMNGFDQISFTITIDDTVPQISLLSPQDGAFVSETDTVRVSILDGNFASVNWTIWGIRWQSTDPELCISLTSSPGDGYFTMQVAAVDLAGNQIQASYTFGMDSAPPEVSIANVASGGAISPGTPIDVVVSDAFLMSVQCSLDSGSMSALAYPHDVDISALGSGFHRIYVVAADATGKTTTLEMQFYVDATAPLVVLATNTTFVEGSTHTVTAEASDDFGVCEVILHYQLPSGVFVTVPMSWDGTCYSAVLLSTMLWDGMSVFAVAVDQVGNSASTPQSTLSASVSPVGDGSGGTAPTDAVTGPGALLSSGWMSIAIIGFLLVLLLAVAAYSFKDRRWRVPGKATPELTIMSSRPAKKTEPAPYPVRDAKPSNTASAAIGRGVSGEKVLKKQEQTRPAPPAPAEVRTEQRPRTVSLVESIPDMPMRSPAKADGEADDIDYGELIERELILPGREGSVYKEDGNEPPRTDFEFMRDIMDDLGRLGPKKPTI